MRIVALTGVPGTGKTTISAELAKRGVAVVDLNAFARDEGLLTEMDAQRGSFVVDMDALADKLNDALNQRTERAVVIEGHFAHEMDVDAIILLRCDPRTLVDRLRARGWRDEKVRENVEAEALDVLAQEVLDAGVAATEIDVTHLSAEGAAEIVLGIVEKPQEALKGDAVGSARWALEGLPWF